MTTYTCFTCAHSFTDEDALERASYEYVDDMYDRPPIREPVITIACPNCGSENLTEDV